MHSDAMSFRTLQRVFLIVGSIGLAASLAMVWRFGMTMSILHAIALCCTSIVAGFIFPIRRFIADMGAPTWASRGLAIAGAFFIGLEGFSHLGYTIGMRTINATDGMVQTAAYEMRNDAVTEARTKLALAESRLKELKAANPWATSISADKLRADIANLEGDAIYRRSKECANVTLPDSRRFCDSLAKAKGQLATIEDYNRTAKAIEASQKILNEHRDIAIATKPGVSTVKAQTDFASKLYLLAAGSKAEEALKPDAVTLTVSDIIIGFFIAVGATLLPTVCFYLAFWSPQAAIKLEGRPPSPSTAAAQQSGQPLALLPEPHASTYHMTIDDAEARRIAEEARARASRAISAAGDVASLQQRVADVFAGYKVRAA